MEDSSPLVSPEQLGSSSAVVHAVRLGPHTVRVWYADGQSSLCTRAPDGELWVDRRSASGQVTRTRVQACAAPSLFGARASDPTGRGDAPDRIVAKTAGTVARVHVSAGAQVQQGEALLTIELMKMELTIAAPRACTVEAVAVTPGQAIEKGTVLVRLA